MKSPRLIYLAVLVCSLFFARVVHACTGIRLTAEDGPVVCARTLEFSIDLQSDVIMVPRGYARTGTTPEGENGMKWTSRYASLGANGVGMPFLFEGVNEKGLAVGLFYFPTTAGYMKYNPAGRDRREKSHAARRDYCICGALKVAPNPQQRETPLRVESRLQALNDIGWK